MKYMYLKCILAMLILIGSSSCLSTSINYQAESAINQDLFDYNNISAKAPEALALNFSNREPAQIKTFSLFEESNEDRLIKNADFYIKNEEWQKAYNELIKYEPVLTFNSEIMNKLIYVSIKLEKYGVAEEQIRSILKPQSEWASQANLVKLLAQLTYLSERYSESQELLDYLKKNSLDDKTKSEVKMYSFLIGYKTNNKAAMEGALNEMKMDHEAYVRFSLYYIEYLKNNDEPIEAFKNLEALYLDNKFETEVTLEYVKYLMDENKFKEVLKAIQSIGPDVTPMQYEQAQLALAYVYLKTGNKIKFENSLKFLVNIDQKALQSLWLGHQSYGTVYGKIYKQEEKATELILTNVKNNTLAGFSNSKTPENFSKGKLKIDNSDSIRLPASLEKNQ